MTAVEPQAAGPSDQLVRRLSGLGGLDSRGRRRYAGRGHRPRACRRPWRRRRTPRGHGRQPGWPTCSPTRRRRAVTLRLVWALTPSSAVPGHRDRDRGRSVPAAVRHRAGRVRRGMRDLRAVRHPAGQAASRSTGSMLPPHAGPDFPRLGHQPAQPPDEVHAPHTVGGQAFEFPFGPVRQVGVETPVLRPGDQRRGSRRPVPVHLAQAPRRGVAAARHDPARGAVPRRARRGPQRRRRRLGVRRGRRGRARHRRRRPRRPGPGRSRWNWNGCTTTPRPSRRCARPPG